MLKKWNIFVPEIQLSHMDPEGDDFSGVLRINSLESHLARKCKDLGIERIYGEFKGFGEGQSIFVKTEENLRPGTFVKVHVTDSREYDLVGML